MNVTLQHLTKRFPNRNKKQGGEVVAGFQVRVQVVFVDAVKTFAGYAGAVAQENAVYIGPVIAVRGQAQLCL